MRVLANQVSCEPGADAQTGHERRQHDRDHRCGDAEVCHGEAKPDHLVEKTAKSGDEEESEVPAHALGRGGWVGNFCLKILWRSFERSCHKSSPICDC